MVTDNRDYGQACLKYVLPGSLQKKAAGVQLIVSYYQVKIKPPCHDSS